MTRQKGCVKKMQFVAIVALFVLATLGFIFSCIYSFLFIKNELINDSSNSLKEIQLLESSSKSLASLQILFWTQINRYYKIWGAKRKTIVFPVCISIINNGLALVELITKVVQTAQSFSGFEDDDISMDRVLVLGFYAQKSFLAVNFFTNLFIPLMIGKLKKILHYHYYPFIDLQSLAGRIWWIGHQVSKFLPMGKFHLTKHVMAICLESGIMYPLALIPALVFGVFNEDLKVGLDGLFAALIQVVGIAPTFIIRDCVIPVVNHMPYTACAQAYCSCMKEKGRRFARHVRG
ncbi:hypothetical protein K435DRAFT_800591 [Dendrothele bispora CBS 962.96]|uniref:Uncharacterized protein n=1 Tax=Dendrothele bispora (strain CBS 962.96) TaxID=1314807 RepID=A0A4S8LRZ9_DENBC|nr:hypothetical protein K435DRAFT_800591 [Dendrothele bispora CBS 962.96]